MVKLIFLLICNYIAQIIPIANDLLKYLISETFQTWVANGYFFQSVETLFIYFMYI